MLHLAAENAEIRRIKDTHSATKIYDVYALLKRDSLNVLTECEEDPAEEN